jgi:hypothetical protein
MVRKLSIVLLLLLAPFCMAQAPGYSRAPGNAQIWPNSWASSTPSGTQYVEFGVHAVLQSAVFGDADLLPRAITVTGVSVALSAAEGSSATLAFKIGYCSGASGGCATPSTTAALCTVGNSAYTCTASALGISIPSGDEIFIQTVQTGTGTAAAGLISFSFN